MRSRRLCLACVLLGTQLAWAWGSAPGSGAEDDDSAGRRAAAGRADGAGAAGAWAAAAWAGGVRAGAPQPCAGALAVRAGGA
jgi:hypothetical protein